MKQHRVTDTRDFAYGSYGDYSGVVFHGPPVGRLWPESLCVSDFYMHPLFDSVLERAWREGIPVPRLAAEWNAVAGWREWDQRRCDVATGDAAEFAAARSRLDEGDVLAECAGCTPAECLRCRDRIQQFIVGVLGRGGPLFIEEN